MDRKAIREIKFFLNKIKKKILINKVIFFGSRTGNEYMNYSDIDLVLVSDSFNGVDFSKRISKMYDYWDNDYNVDFFCYTQKEFDKLSKQIGIISEAKKGIEIL